MHGRKAAIACKGVVLYSLTIQLGKGHLLLEISIVLFGCHRRGLECGQDVATCKLHLTAL